MSIKPTKLSDLTGHYYAIDAFGKIITTLWKESIYFMTIKIFAHPTMSAVGVLKKAQASLERERF